MGSGSYTGVYVCIPYPNDYIWVPVVIAQFLVVIAGCASHVLFFKLAIAGQKFGAYSRITFGSISLMMLVMLLTSTSAFLLTLANGKLIEDCEISSIELRKWLLYVHSFGEYFFVVSELMGTFERVTSTFCPKIRKSKCFSTLFASGCILGAAMAVVYIYLVRIAFKVHMFAIGFGSLTAMEFLNGAIVVALWKVAKTKYTRNKDVPLHVRYQFSQSYAYCRCATASVAARLLILFYVYMKLAGFFDGKMDSPFFYAMNLLINLYCLVYPWTIMICHRRICSKIRKWIEQYPQFRRKKVAEEKTIKPLYTIDGKEMNGNGNHFEQLNTFWNISATPSRNGN